MTPLLLPAALMLLQSDPWSGVLAQLHKELKSSPGMGCVVMVERKDATTLRLRVKTVGVGFKFIEAESFPSHTGIIKADTPQMMDSFDGTALIPADATELAVRLAGEQFSPQLRIAIPKAGDKAQTASMVMGLRTKE